MKSLLSGIVACLLLIAVLAVPWPASAQTDGEWLDYSDTEAEDGLPLLEPEPFVTDAIDSAAVDSGGASTSPSELSSQFFLFEEIFLAPSLEFESWGLQDVLGENILREEENVSWHEIFRADSSLSLNLFQLRDEEFPHYHLLSDLWVYIWRGRGELTVDERAVPFAPGQFFQIPSGTLHSFKNISGAPTVGMIWARPPLVDSLTVEIIPEEVLARMRADSLRAVDLQERTLYKKR